MVGLVLLILLVSAPLAVADCQRKCGDIEIPYPFGILHDPAEAGKDSECFMEGFDITCNTTSVPHKALLGTGNIEVLKIDLDGLLQVNQFLAHDCSYANGTPIRNNPSMDLKHKPYRFSNERNKFVAVGCQTLAIINDIDDKFSVGCYTSCRNMSYVINDTCSGIGCCETSVPKGLRGFDIEVRNILNNSDDCSYAFLADDSFRFNASILTSFRNVTNMPVALEWAIGNKTCDKAQNESDYACRSAHSICMNSTNGQGYRCNCSTGWQGNPYVVGGCKDVDECEIPENECLPGQCRNTGGSYECYCPKGMRGDGRKNGSGCTSIHAMLQMIVGICASVIVLVTSTSWLYLTLRKRRFMQLREKFFKENGGSLLAQKISSVGSATNSMKIFTVEELQRATDNYDEKNIIGKGGFGIVYKGTLWDQRTVAIKRSKISDKNQKEQFVNEVIVLSNIIHRNVLKLLGCCLETEVPLLVYEFMANGTLSEHLHNEECKVSLSWEDRLRIASESAEALAYMHYSASAPILHRDVKSSNILLDDNFTAKVSDFGTSRLSSDDQSCLASLVKGTFGYLDPEYLHTGQFSDKSDVYSFGIVLIELLTGEKAISKRLSQWNGNLSNYFISNLNENRLFDIVEAHLLNEGTSDQLMAVAKLAKRCLLLNGDERPTMREVAATLESLRTYKKHSWTEESDLIAEPLINEPAFGGSTSGTFSHNGSLYSDIMPLNIMR